MSDHVLVREALQLFDAGFNCAESIFFAGAKFLGMEDKNVPRLATGFGGGLSRTKSVCGALTGAVMVLGYRFGRTKLEDDRSLIISKVQDLNLAFLDKFGSTNCFSLTGLDFNSEEGKERYRNKVHMEICREIVAFTSFELFKLLEHSGEQP